MIKVTEEQFEEFKRYVYNYIKDLKIQVNTLGNAVYKTDDEVYGRHWFDYNGAWEIDEGIYHKLFETDFMNHVREYMNFCEGCYQLIFKEAQYCSDKCKSKHEE